MADRYASLKQGLVGCWIPSISGSGLLLPDLSGRNNNGALTNMDASDWVSASYGRALDFDGVNDRVQHTAIALTGACSASLYFNRRSSGTGGESILWGNSSSDYNYIDITSNAVIIADNVSVKTYAGFSIANNVWYHLAFSRDSSGNTRVYLNGTESTSGSQALANSITFDLIGHYRLTITGYNLDGRIDDARLYNRALMEPEIKLLASEPGIGFKPAKKLSRFSQRFTYKPAKPRNYSVIRNRDPNYSTLRQGLVAAYCPSISGQGNVLPDLVGGNHGTLNGMDASDWVSSGDGRALDFDGTDDYINVADTNTLSPTSAMSISFWAKPTALPAASNGNRMWAVTKGDTSNFEYECSINSFSTSFGKWNCSYYNLAADGVRARASVVDAIAGQWQHVCWTAGRDGDFPNIYFNGELSNGATISFLTPTPSNGTAPLQIGRRANGSDVTFNGQLDDIRLYSRVLTPSEIKLLASKRGIGLEPRKPKITFADLGVQKTYSVVRVKETDYATLRQGLVGAWCPSLPNGGSGNTLPDQSGYNNHGSLVNMSPDDWVSGQYGRALDFDGSNDYVTSPNSQDFVSGSQVTASIWVKRNAAGSYYELINKWLSTSTPTEDGWLLRWDNTNKILFTIARSGSYGQFQATNADTRIDWSHLAVVHEFGVTAKTAIYLNGAAISASWTSGGTQVPDSDATFAPVTIGALRYQGGPFNYLSGQIDDARVYNRVLSESEIRLLASRPGIGLRQESHRNTFYQFPSFQPALARRSSAIIGGGIT